MPLLLLLPRGQLGKLTDNLFSQQASYLRCSCVTKAYQVFSLTGQAKTCPTLQRELEGCKGLGHQGVQRWAGLLRGPEEISQCRTPHCSHFVPHLGTWTFRKVPGQRPCSG